MLEVNPYRELVEALELGPNREALQERYGLALDYAREAVQGRVYENEAVRLVHGPRGLFYELKAVPEVSYARFGVTAGEFVDAREVQGFVWYALTLAEAGEAEVLVIYGPNYLEDDEDLFMAYTLDGERYYRGEPRQAEPLFVRLEARTGAEVLVRAAEGYLRFTLDRGVPVLGGVHE
ncbi:hypothetical protein [Marinithermus hydrothermalis]|uniref:Uncharacterized protein n=1 Tax=Marinithermus hydrothermalis (strain DSM 14884 / JCM 11576 / T1) TaxID=869210 RepID=F2NNC8_MARHT|nr:hypothetical protein [Marinithermus hydrothermalis]AEB10969.1 hypothetical protein Marky_0208 [Marinithermus hydrothermalis DSM 14884]